MRDGVPNPCLSLHDNRYVTISVADTYHYAIGACGAA